MLNGTMMQYFHWYYPDGGKLWKEVKENANELAAMGINALWLPPAYKGMAGAHTNGYDVYDLYDLGEFDQKGTIATKFGTKAGYIEAIKALHEKGIQVYADVVLNHKGGADEKEKIQVIRANPEDRTQFDGDPFSIEAYTKFTFPGRKGKYSAFIWDFHCFSGIDYAEDLDEKGVFSIVNEYGKDWEEVVGNEKGNYDYLMLADVEFRNPAVREELKNWGTWYLEQTSFDGVRLDAIKHISPAFLNEWLDYMRTMKPGLFAVGEYWAPGCLDLTLKYIEITEGKMSLFDACLQHNFHQASKGGKEYDLATIF
ncbi:MAG TPA: alpha-amylase, partial [Chitinophagaceae bacterium]|nr:alpha-amylase [Chitinophagaceae bacterium]